jgi:hypothetical protein
LVYDTRKAITQKYDDRFDVNNKEVKIGLMWYSRIVKDNDEDDVTSHQINLIECDNDCDMFELKCCGEDTYLHTSQVFVVSVRDL